MSSTARPLVASRLVVIAATALTAFAGVNLLGSPVGASAVPKATTVPKVGRLDSISCPTSTFCMAVGQGLDKISSTDVTNAVLEYTGGSWKTAEFANPSSSTTNWQTVSCTSASFCLAVGATTLNKVAVAEYNGSSWTLLRSVSITYVADSPVMQASCSGTYCLVTGYANAEVMKVSGSSVTQVALPVPSGDTTQNIGVWCDNSTYCRVAGWAAGSAGTANLDFIWDGSAFRNSSAPVDSGVLGISLACTATTFCLTWDAYLKANVMGVEHFDGSTWAAETTSFSGSDSLSVAAGFSCVSPTWCLQGGYYYNSGLTSFLPMAYIMTGSTWKASALPTLGHFGFLTGVACTSSTDCYAVGMYTTSKTLSGAKYTPDLLHYDGSAWTSIKVSGLV